MADTAVNGTAVEMSRRHPFAADEWRLIRQR